jgi:hypothetical protein
MAHNIITNITEKEIAQAKDNQIVKLNIGGTPVYTYYNTLAEFSDFFKELLQRPATELTLVNGDEIFIDRDPIIFINGIMNYLRPDLPCLPPPSIEHQDFYEDLKEEAEFYQIEGLAQLCCISLEEMDNRADVYHIMDFDSLKDLVKSRKGKKYGDFEYIDVNDMDGKDGTIHLISILRSTQGVGGYDKDDEPDVHFLVRKTDV